MHGNMHGTHDNATDKHAMSVGGMARGTLVHIRMDANMCRMRTNATCHIKPTNDMTRGMRQIRMHMHMDACTHAYKQTVRARAPSSHSEATGEAARVSASFNSGNTDVNRLTSFLAEKARASVSWAPPPPLAPPPVCACSLLDSTNWPSDLKPRECVWCVSDRGVCVSFSLTIKLVSDLKPRDKSCTPSDSMA